MRFATSSYLTEMYTPETFKSQLQHLRYSTQELMTEVIDNSSPVDVVSYITRAIKHAWRLNGILGVVAGYLLIPLAPKLLLAGLAVNVFSRVIHKGLEKLPAPERTRVKTGLATTRKHLEKMKSGAKETEDKTRIDRELAEIATLEKRVDTAVKPATDKK